MTFSKKFSLGLKLHRSSWCLICVAKFPLVTKPTFEVMNGLYVLKVALLPYLFTLAKTELLYPKNAGA